MSGFIINPYVFAVVTGGGPDDTEYYFTLTIDAAEVDAALTDFPVYVRLADAPAAFWTNVQSDGGDIRVTESDGTTRCPADLVDIDTTGETGELHFLASSLSSSSNTVFRVYYGKTGGGLSQPAAGDTYGRNAVWADYAAVYHGNDGTDSTGNGNTLSTGAGTPTTGSTAAKIGDTFAFDAGDHLAADDAATLDITGDISLSAWGNLDAFDSLTALITKYDTVSQNSYYLAFNGGPSLEMAFASGSSFSRATADTAYTTGMFNTWKHYVGTADVSEGGSGITLYDDGATKASSVTSNSVTSIGNSTAKVRIGDFSRQAAPGYFNWNWDGEIDEVRIRPSVISGDWVAAEYSNQNTPTTFYSVGTQQSA